MLSLSEEFNRRLDQTNTRLDSLFRVVVKREEHYTLENKVLELEKEVKQIKEKMVG
jgi:hypothetical protein